MAPPAVQGVSCPPSMKRVKWHLADYKPIRELYEGEYSLVVEAQCRHSRLPVVLKMYVKEGLNPVYRRQIEREVLTHSKLSHRHIIDFYGAFEDDYCYYLVLEPAAGGLIHRDIKPENVLLTRDGILKLADFGVVVNKFEERPVSRAGTTQYMAPEIIRNPLKPTPDAFKDREDLAYDEKVDIWSAGVMIYELLYGAPPFGNPQHTAAEILSLRISAVDLRHPSHIRQLSPEAKDFLDTCIRKQPEGRRCATELLFHDWLQLKGGQLHSRRPCRSFSMPQVRPLLIPQGNGGPAPGMAPPVAAGLQTPPEHKPSGSPPSPFAAKAIDARRPVRESRTSGDLSTRVEATQARHTRADPEEPRRLLGTRRNTPHPKARLPPRVSQTSQHLPDLVDPSRRHLHKNGNAATKAVTKAAETSNVQRSHFSELLFDNGGAACLSSMSNGSSLGRSGHWFGFRKSMKLPSLVKRGAEHSPADMAKLQASKLKTSFYNAVKMLPAIVNKQQEKAGDLPPGRTVGMQC
eukprot:jgi/Tetstr1/458194/TSEL_044685.t1